MLRKLGLHSSSCSYVPCAISATMGWVAEHVFGRSEYAEKGQAPRLTTSANALTSIKPISSPN